MFMKVIFILIIPPPPKKKKPQTNKQSDKQNKLLGQSQNVHLIPKKNIKSVVDNKKKVQTLSPVCTNSLTDKVI